MIVASSLLVLALSYPFSRQIFQFYNASDQILEYCIAYFNIRIFGFPFALFVFAIFGTFRGLQNTFYPMIIAIIGASLNIVLDIILVYGIEGYIPAMHVEGAAYASVIAQVVMAIISLVGNYLIRVFFDAKASIHTISSNRLLPTNGIPKSLALGFCPK